jgi:hypothetical protein
MVTMAVPIFGYGISNLVKASEDKRTPEAVGGASGSGFANAELPVPIPDSGALT